MRTERHILRNCPAARGTWTEVAGLSLYPKVPYLYLIHSRTPSYLWPGKEIAKGLLVLIAAHPSLEV